MFEFRDPTWFDDAVYETLARHGASFCIYELAGTLSPVRVIADTAYVRLHGPGDAYEGSYDDKALRAWAERLMGWAADGKEVFCYFDNDQAGHAV